MDDYQPPLKHFLPVNPLRKMFFGCPALVEAGTATEFASVSKRMQQLEESCHRNREIPSGYVNVAMEDNV